MRLERIDRDELGAVERPARAVERARLERGVEVRERERAGLEQVIRAGLRWLHGMHGGPAEQRGERDVDIDRPIAGGLHLRYAHLSHRDRLAIDHDGEPARGLALRTSCDLEAREADERVRRWWRRRRRAAELAILVGYRLVALASIEHRAHARQCTLALQERERICLQRGARVRAGIPVDRVIAAARGGAEPAREQELADDVLEQPRFVAGAPRGPP